MNTVAWIFSVLNLLFGIVIILPCLMIAAFSGDNPKAAEMKFYQLLVMFLLSLPVLFMASGLGSMVLVWYNYTKFGIYLDLAPWFWLILFFSVSILLGKIEW